MELSTRHDTTRHDQTGTTGRGRVWREERRTGVSWLAQGTGAPGLVAPDRQVQCHNHADRTPVPCCPTASSSSSTTSISTFHLPEERPVTGDGGRKAGRYPGTISEFWRSAILAQVVVLLFTDPPSPWYDVWCIIAVRLRSAQGVSDLGGSSLTFSSPLAATLDTMYSSPEPRVPYLALPCLQKLWRLTVAISRETVRVLRTVLSENLRRRTPIADKDMPASWNLPLVGIELCLCKSSPRITIRKTDSTLKLAVAPDRIVV